MEHRTSDDVGMAALRASKKALREEVTQLLHGLSGTSVDRQSKVAVSTLLAMKEYQQAKRISIYLSIEGKEIATTSIIKHALSQRKLVFIPYLHSAQTPEGSKTSVMNMLALKSIEDLHSFQRDKWGIPSIPKDTVEQRDNCFGGLGVDGGRETGASNLGLDFIVMPGMAFDRMRGRLGHGKGYYDKFLDRCKGMVDQRQLKDMPLLVALTLDEQLLDLGREVPKGQHDWLVDRVVLGSGLVI